MKKIISAVAIAILSALYVNAQEQLEPGIYSVVDSCYTSLSFSPGINKSSSTNILGVEVGDSGSSYKGETSGVECTGSLVMVINPEKKERVAFEWEQIDDVTFWISFEAAPGEYAVVFKGAKLGDYDFASIYGFTVAE